MLADSSAIVAPPDSYVSLTTVRTRSGAGLVVQLPVPSCSSVDNRIFLKEKRLWLGRGPFVFCFCAAILDTCKT
jgi:hypothetical protein